MRFEVNSEARQLVRQVTAVYGERGAREFLLCKFSSAASLHGALQEARAALEEPYRCLEALYRHYAFARRGRERHDLARIAVEAFHRAVPLPDFPRFLASSGAEDIWRRFVEVCAEHGRKPLENLNRGAIAGFAELAQEAFRADGTGSVARWVVNTVNRTGRIEPLFMRMVDLRGVGPKLASLILRDVCFVFEVERRVHPADRLYLQPIDKWLRHLGPLFAEESDPADWVLAGKVAKAVRREGASGAMFNMGVTYLGSRVAHTFEAFEAEVTRMLGLPAALAKA